MSAEWNSTIRGKGRSPVLGTVAIPASQMGSSGGPNTQGIRAEALYFTPSLVLGALESVLAGVYWAGTLPLTLAGVRDKETHSPTQWHAEAGG